jgi:hypothetical protein
MVIEGVALQPHAIAAHAVGVELAGTINADVDLVADGLEQALGLGGALIYVIDKAIWVLCVSKM